MKIYPVIADAIHEEILPVLEKMPGVDDAYESYDVDAIADEVLEYYQHIDHQGIVHLDYCGYKLAVDRDTLKDIAEENQLTD